jgi:hypothetical protein
MLAHKDYYAPLLEEEEAEMEAARKAVAEGAVEQLGEGGGSADDEKEKETKEGKEKK